jgi:hypothetical protein
MDCTSGKQQCEHRIIDPWEGTGTNRTNRTSPPRPPASDGGSAEYGTSPGVITASVVILGLFVAAVMGITQLVKWLA